MQPSAGPGVDEAETGLVTGEAVELDVRPTGFALRAAGAAIDVLLYALATAGAELLVVWLATDSGIESASVTAMGIIIAVAGLVVAPAIVEWVTRGRSLGRLVVGARIVRDDGGAIALRHAFIRSLLGLLELFATAGGVAATVGLLHPRTKRLGDLVAGTYSLHERVPRPAAFDAVVPPPLADWARIADVARLPDPLARRVAHFLRQSLAMNPASRVRLARDLADEVAAYVHPVPPVPADMFLLGVAALRRERDAVALERQAQVVRRLEPVLGNPHGFPERG